MRWMDWTMWMPQRELKRAEDYNDQLTETVGLTDPF